MSWFKHIDDDSLLAEPEEKFVHPEELPDEAVAAALDETKALMKLQPSKAIGAKISKLNLVTRVGKILSEQPFNWARYDEFHPSQLKDFCAHEAHYLHVDRKRYAGDPKVDGHTAAAKRLIAFMGSRTLDPDKYPKMGVGTATHAMLQYYGGLIGELLGRWRCTHCGWETPLDEEIPMPTALVQDTFGNYSTVAAECPECKANLNSHDWPWIYLEPHFLLPEFNAKGQCDGVRATKGLRGIVEFKTIKSTGYDEKYGTLPLDEHVLQVNCYAYALKADFVDIIYINKDTAETKEFILPAQPEILIPMFARLRVAKLARETGKRPDMLWRVCNKITDSRAQKCAFAELCFGRKRPLNALG